MAVYAIKSGQINTIYSINFEDMISDWLKTKGNVDQVL